MRRRGRKPKRAAEKQDFVIAVRVTRAEKQRIFAAAAKTGMPAATLARAAVLERARELIE
jgi:predicted Zn-dependent protease